jgi:hypothetical protein
MSTPNTTIIYYTSNHEDPKFEAKIQANIIKQKGDLPIISVSQKPIDFGNNICVGDVGLSYLNEFRQILIAAKAAETPYLVIAESDFLYPECYFTFEPKGANVYRYNNVWIVFSKKLFSYRRKIYSEGAQICQRSYLIDLLEQSLKGRPMWYNGATPVKPGEGNPRNNIFNIPFEFFGDSPPCISFKTGNGLRGQTNTMHGRVNIRMKLPYWGYISDIRKGYLGTDY